MPGWITAPVVGWAGSKLSGSVIPPVGEPKPGGTLVVEVEWAGVDIPVVVSEGDHVGP